MSENHVIFTYLYKRREIEKKIVSKNVECSMILDDLKNTFYLLTYTKEQKLKKLNCIKILILRDLAIAHACCPPKEKKIFFRESDLLI